jgi:DNA-binding transcriptional ArsR family regulator
MPQRKAAERRARLFAALGDETRLALLTRLSSGKPHSIAQLTQDSRLTRQAITKHLRILQTAKLVRCTRTGRESLFAFNPQPILTLQKYLALVSTEWDEALVRLKQLAEGES